MSIAVPLSNSASHDLNSEAPLSVQIVKLPHGEGLDLPAYATKASAGMDLLAAIEDNITLEAGQRKLVPTGIAIALPPGFEAQVRPRSGWALKEGITVLNSPGTIDADYRGEIGVILFNSSEKPVEISRGMRIAQMVIAAYNQVTWQQVDNLEESERGMSGFGSTGKI